MLCQKVKSGKQTQKGGKGKKKKLTLKFSVDCTHPAEDGIMDTANFVSSSSGEGMIGVRRDTEAQIEVADGTSCVHGNSFRRFE